ARSHLVRSLGRACVYVWFVLVWSIRHRAGHARHDRRRRTGRHRNALPRAGTSASEATRRANRTPTRPSRNARRNRAPIGGPMTEHAIRTFAILAVIGLAVVLSERIIRQLLTAAR